MRGRKWLVRGGGVPYKRRARPGRGMEPLSCECARKRRTGVSRRSPRACGRTSALTATRVRPGASRRARLCASAAYRRWLYLVAARLRRLLEPRTDAGDGWRLHAGIPVGTSGASFVYAGRSFCAASGEPRGGKGGLPRPQNAGRHMSSRMNRRRRKMHRAYIECRSDLGCRRCLQAGPWSLAGIWRRGARWGRLGPTLELVGHCAGR